MQILHDGLGTVYIRMLIEVTETYARKPFYFACVLRQSSRNYIHKRGFARAVQSDYADMLAVVDGEIRVVEKYFIVEYVGKTLYRKNTHSTDYFTL